MAEVNSTEDENTAEADVKDVKAETNEASNDEFENSTENLESKEDSVKENEENITELDSKKKEIDYKEKFYYVAAEMENLQKRHVREREKLLKFGNEKILSSLLEVVDNLDRTIDAASSEQDEKVKQIVTGINMVKTQFLTVLKDSGLEEVKTIGESFDPNFHEALTQQPAEGKEDQEILTEFQKGYILNGRLLRAAKVVVVKN